MPPFARACGYPFGSRLPYPGRGESELLRLLSKLTGSEFRNPHSEVTNDLYPAFDLYPHLDYVCMITHGDVLSMHLLRLPSIERGFIRRVLRVVKEIDQSMAHTASIYIVFYDDALLADRRPISSHLEGDHQRRHPVQFSYSERPPCSEIDPELAVLLFRAGFKTIRLGLETSNEEAQIETGAKSEQLRVPKALRI